MAAKGIHISIAAEKVTQIDLPYIGEFVITNAMISSTLVITVLVWLGIYIRLNLKEKGMPSRSQLIVESIYQLMEGIVKQGLGSGNTYRKYLGLVIVLFLYIVLGSWFGLLPGVLYWGYDNGKEIIPYLRAPTTDLSATTALAITAFFAIQYAGISTLGFFGYLGKFLSFKSGAGGFVLGLFEIIQELTRLVSFSFRLFGNIFAGEVLLAVITYLTRFNDTSNPNNIINLFGVPAPALVILFEFFVALIQAYVFVNLMVVFIAMAGEKPHGDETHHDDKLEHAKIEGVAVPA